MKDLKKILAVIDPTVEDQPAVRRAAWLAKQSNAELELLVCYYNEYLSGDRQSDVVTTESTGGCQSCQVSARSRINEML